MPRFRAHMGIGEIEKAFKGMFLRFLGCRSMQLLDASSKSCIDFGDTLYWAKRKGSHPELKNSVARLLKKQKGKCNWCNLTFQDGDLIETDHITPQAVGGTQPNNLQLLHKHCHDKKTREDLNAIKKHKSQKEWNKYLNQFNKMNWEWIDDIPTLV